MSIVFRRFLCETFFSCHFALVVSPRTIPSQLLDVEIHAVLPYSTAQHRHSVVVGNKTSISSTGDQLLLLE